MSFMFVFFFLFSFLGSAYPHSLTTWFPDISQILREHSNCLSEAGSWEKGQWGRAMHINWKYLCITWANKITGSDWNWHTEVINSTHCFKYLINWFILLFLSPFQAAQSVLWKLLDTREDIHVSANPCICYLLSFWTVLMLSGMAAWEGAGREQSCHQDKASIRKREENTSAILTSTRFDGDTVFVNSLFGCLLIFVYLFIYCEWEFYTVEMRLFFLKGWSRRRKYLRTSYLFSALVLSMGFYRAWDFLRWKLLTR